LRRSNVGLLAHPASVSQALRHVLEVFGDLRIDPVVLFGPEHGWAGHAQDQVEVTEGDAQLQPESPPTRIVSLYGDSYSDLSPSLDDLSGLDVVVIDLQDVGSRYYTFVWTAVLVARACRDAGVRVLVLDRPNPIGTSLSALEGRLQLAAFRSFVGLEPVPIRHGLTLGDIVSWRAVCEGYTELVQVVEVEGVSAEDHAPAWGRPFVMPSPNMPTYETALVYPGGCLVEGTNLSEGRGTTRPFEIVGAPWLSGARLASAMMRLELPGFLARPVSFEPTFHKFAHTRCHGVQIHVTDPREFRPVATYTALCALAHQQAPADFKFRTETYEFVDTIPAFDLLTGSAEARKRIEAGDDARAIAALVAHVGADEKTLVAEARDARRRVALDRLG